MKKEKAVAGNPAVASPRKKPASAKSVNTKKVAAKTAVKATGVKAKASVKAKEKSKPKKVEKSKVIRDSFTLPADDYAKLSELKQACLKDGLHVKKSELVRAGLRVLSKLDGPRLRAEMAALDKVKTGRPKSK